MNSKNFGNDPGAANSGSGRPLGNFSLARQPSVYSLTFDEFMNTMGGSGKDFGSMNMDELLKNIWTAGEIQTIASTSGGQQGMGGPAAHLQRQGSWTLPRTLSHKTVDEVWKDMSKDYGAVKGGNNTDNASGGPNFPQRQQTLGEMTLEEFLVRAGVVREDTPLGVGNGKLNGGVLADLSRAGAGNNSGLGIGFQQLGKSTGLIGNRIAGSNGQIAIQSSTNLPLNVNGVRSNHQSQPLPPPSSQQIFTNSKPAIPDYASQIPLTNNAQLDNQGIRVGFVGLDQGFNGNLVESSALQGGGMGMGMGMVGLVPGPVNLTTSPANQLSCDEVRKSNGDTSSVSPVPYVFNGGLRGRKSGGAVEKVIERRQRRMIKNRESAARSRARKQAYTMELEEEVAKLKEENQELQRKQEEIMEMQKNQAMEMNLQRDKKRCLRRTQTGPW